MACDDENVIQLFPFYKGDKGDTGASTAEAQAAALAAQQAADAAQAIADGLNGPTGSTKVGYNFGAPSGKQLTVDDLIRSGIRSVVEFNSLVGDHTNAFDAAVANAVAGNPQALVRPNMPSADWVVIRVPAGNWTLTRYVNVLGRKVVWLLDPGAVVNGIDYLNGRVERQGMRINDLSHGITDSACAFSVSAGRGLDAQAQISGFMNPNEVSAGNGRDAAALYADIRATAPIYGAASVSGYSAQMVVLATPMTVSQMLQLKRGMWVTTRHATPCHGVLTDWTTNSLTVQSWIPQTGVSGAASIVPAGTTGLDVGVFRKVFAGNMNSFLETDSYSNAANTTEFGIRNKKGEVTSRGGVIEANILYLGNIGADTDNYVDAGAIVNGKVTYAYKVNGGATHGLYLEGSRNPMGDPLSTVVWARNRQGTSFYQVGSIGNTHQGLRGGGVATTVYSDYHSGSADCPYDVRFQSTGGNGTAGGGTATIVASTLLLNSSTSIDFYTVGRPNTDNNIGWGQSGRRWSTIYAGTGTINTSDQRHKTDIRSLNEKEIAVGKALLKMIKIFKFKDAVDRKGDADARLHAGVIAQEVRDVFTANGLDAFAYGVLCYDEWEDEFIDHPEERRQEPAIYSELLDEDGHPICLVPAVDIVVKEAWREQTTVAGNLFAIRYDELWAFIFGALDL